MGAEVRAWVFDEHADSWHQWQQTPWGRLRYRVVAETLRRTTAALGQAPLRVLDVGGGDGADSVPLAADGHHVTIADVSEPLLERAHERATHAGTAVTTVVAPLAALHTCGLGVFDLVLCHNVLQYQADDATAIAALAALVSDQGAVSILSPNPSADVLAAAIRREEPGEALALLDAPSVPAVTFSTQVRRIEPETVESVLAAAGFAVDARYGVLAVTTFIANDARKSEPEFYADLEHLELALCDREPFRRTARFWQLVARRHPEPRT